MAKRNLGQLWQVESQVPVGSADRVATALSARFRETPVIATTPSSDLASVRLYLERLPCAPRKLRGLLQEAISESGLLLEDLPARSLRIRRLAREDWANSWKRHFRPLEIGSALLIRPSWSKKAPRSGQALVTLDPGLSFGTGDHPTTQFCLQHLCSVRATVRSPSLFDAGTGSGILAIAGAKLGYVGIDAIDNDPAAVRTARSNACANGVERRIRFRVADLGQRASWPRRRYDVICANLTADLLLWWLRRFIDRLAPAGRLVLAGILAREFGPLVGACDSLGLRLTDSQLSGEWRSGAFLR